jgi:hypothetical protein
MKLCGCYYQSVFYLVVLYFILYAKKVSENHAKFKFNCFNPRRSSLRKMQLHQFVPHTRVHLAANISMALSQMYKQKFDVSIPLW